MSITPECPRCGGGIPNSQHPGLYPGALSRWDNITEVCSDCGTQEAMAQFFAAKAKLDPMQAVHPIHGELPWRHPEVALNR